ncbi:GNAT family N-acetyltransferase [Thermococcus sp. CX2]|nr:GNAT family N-acetyltransferase [Thermococcus sp. CX2]NJE85844.1 GNAT family N-acetyltransferase [Thermococcus sp. CX2]
MEVSREFSKFPLGEEEYLDSYSRVIGRLLSYGRHKFFVAVDGKNRYLGHVWVCLLEDTVDFVMTAYIYDIEVKSKGRGIGSALLRSAEEWAKARGALKVSLRVEKDNPAIDWYRKRGYTERALILEKTL